MEAKNKSRLIEQYLFNQMSESEKKEFEAQINSNPAFAEEFELQKSLFEIASDEDFNEIFPSLKSAEQAYLADQPKKLAVRFSTKKILLYAASIMFIAISSWLFFANNSRIESSELFAIYYEPYPMILSFRGKNDQMAIAVNNYNEKKYESVLQSMNQLISDDSLGFVPYLYLGIANLELGNLERAIENFKVVSESDNPTYRQQAKWYIALTFLKANEVEKARKLLLELDRDPDLMVNQASVKDILDSLSE